MSIVIAASKIDGGQESIEIDRTPDECPICHSKIHTQISNIAFATDLFTRWRLQVVYRCPNHNCLSFFIGDYYQDKARQRYAILTSLAPFSFDGRDFSESISSLSPSFCEIYLQAMAAEAHGLDQICGVGYRKALEFLIKDYAISLDSTKEEEIKRIMLGPCIDKYVDDSRIKACAKRATWLGNDETHYERRWVDKDLKDLKILIELTVNWIESVKLTEKYGIEMNT
jgi:hypothetical protein